MEIKLFIPLLLLVLLTFVTGKSSPTFTAEESSAISQLRELIDRIGDQHQVHDYMKADRYLLRWLKARDMKVGEAFEMFQKSLVWRKEEKMDEIVDEAFPEFSNKDLYHSDGIDKAGRPVGTVPVGNWDIRRHVLSSNPRRIYRYLDRLLEKMEVEIRARDAGDGILIYNMNGYSSRLHACPACIPVFIDYVKHYEAYHPNLLKKIVFINTPKTFDALYKILTPFLSEKTQNSIQIFTHDRAKWSKYILKHVDLDQLTREFGGTKERNY